MTKANFGVVGMAVMGRNLALNVESRGYSVAIYNRSADKTEDVVASNPGKTWYQVTMWKALWHQSKTTSHYAYGSSWSIQMQPFKRSCHTWMKATS